MIVISFLRPKMLKLVDKFHHKVGRYKTKKIVKFYRKEKFMNLGEKLYQLRKTKNLSQEEAAEKLNVTRQTISKWETNQSTPDFDKIIPLCNLYKISTDELLTNQLKEKRQNIEQDDQNEIKVKRARAVSISIFLYFISIIWIIIGESIEEINDNILVGIFMFICALATVNITYQFMSTSSKIDQKPKKKYKDIDSILKMTFLIIYMVISFITMAWYITWLIWIVYILVIKIIHLILELREK